MVKADEKRRETLYFISGLFPAERYGEIRAFSKIGLQNAANNLQWKFVKGYDACLGVENVHLLNSEYIGSYPARYRAPYIPHYTFMHAKGAACDIGTGFINLPVLKEFSRAKRLMIEIDKIKDKEDGFLYFVGYAATYPILKALQHAKSRFPNSVCCLIVPDLPQYMELSKKGAGVLHKIKNQIVSRKMKKMDCYVPLTAAMAPYLGTDLAHCAVVEGIADVDGSTSVLPTPTLSNLPKRYILYAGTLQYRYGIGDLLSAFTQINDENLGLVVCGDGEAAEDIKRLQKDDSRICYLGVLPPNEIASLRNEAKILVNPRKNEGEFTKFSFPSKMMEYLASGIPTVAYKLDGMPEDYNGLFIDATEDGLKASIERVLDTDFSDFSQLAAYAKKYVLDKKSPERQCERTLELLRREATANVR